MKNKGLIIVGGYIGILPFGGVTWDYIQYVLGFKQLGFEVIYLEDTRLYPLYQKGESNWNNSSPIIGNLSAIMKRFGLSKSWIYRDEVTETAYGMDLSLFQSKCAEADFFVNVSCSTIMRDEYYKIPHRILIDSDPMFTQIQQATGDSLTEGVNTMNELVSSHNKLFSFAENINGDNCLIPTLGRDYQTTRQPIVLDHWQVKPIGPDDPFTTLMNYSLGKKLIYEGEQWGQKDVEFEHIKKLPLFLTEEKFKISVSKTGSVLSEDERSIFTSNGWDLKDPEATSRNELIYRDFIQTSKGEISIAKHTYVKANTGWFSGRSACYLASGRPVITQDTGWSKFYTTGIGLFSFKTTEEAKDAIELISRDLKSNSENARLIAESYFDSDKVLTDLINKASESPV